MVYEKMYDLYNCLRILIFTLLCGIGELLLNGMGWYIPGVGIAAYYLFTVAPWWRALLPLVAVAMAVDIIHGRTPGTTISIVFVAYILACKWNCNGDRRRYLLQFVPGVILAGWGGTVIHAVEAIRINDWNNTFISGRFITYLFSSMPLGALACIIFCRLADELSDRCELPAFSGKN
jgi:hypothetical protein